MKTKIKLKTALLGNAIFSSLSGVLMLVFSQKLNTLMGITEPVVLPLIGAGLLFFAGTIFYQATRNPISAKQVKLIIAQDSLWVIGSLIIIISGMFELTTIGFVLIGIVAVAVADFAFVQWVGLKYYVNMEIGKPN